MSKAYINFHQKFQTPMLNNIKVCTSRPYPMGKVGDVFSAFRRSFEITKVERQTLQYVRDNLFIQEGFTKPADFVTTWANIHYIKGFVPEQKVYVHWFKLLPE